VRDGYAPRLYVLDDTACVHGECVRWSQLWRDPRRRSATGLEAIVPREAVVPLLDERPLAPGTYEEAEAAWARLEPLGVRRLLLVTDEFHSRRATLAWRKVVAGRAEVHSVPCSARCISVRGWWQDRHALLAIWLEIPKFAVYLREGRLSPAALARSRAWRPGSDFIARTDSSRSSAPGRP
jgi:hypothetical protein